MGVHWKIRFLERVHKKQFFIGVGAGVDCLKRGAWIVCRFKRGLGKKEGVVFLRGGEREGGWDPDAHYELDESSYRHKYPNQMAL